MFVTFTDPYGDDVVINSNKIIKIVCGVTHTSHTGEMCELILENGSVQTVLGHHEELVPQLNNISTKRCMEHYQDPVCGD